jgi:hypothetical protein
MSLPGSGQIDMYSIEVEAGFSGGSYIYLDHATIRALAGKAGSGTQVAFSDFYGKSSFSAAGVNAFASKGHSTAGSISCGPYVNVAGGTAPYSYSWSFTYNPNGCALSFNTSQTCSVTANYGQTTDTTYNATLQCVVSDSAGHSVTVTGINATMTVSYTG